MATIASLVVNVGANPQGLKAGLTTAAQYLKDFARAADNALATSGRGNRGSQLADSIIGNLKDRLVTGSDKVREDLFRGLLNPQAASAAARRAAQAMNTTILATLGELRTRGLATPEIEHMLIAELSEAGLAAGTAGGAAAGRTFAQTLTATIHRHRALIPTLAGLILSQAIPAGGDIASATGGLDRVVQTGNAAEKILENVAMLASFLLKPVPGLIAAVVGGAAAAVVKIWTHAKEEILKQRKEFLAEFTKMIDDIDQIALQKKLQEVTEGKRSAGISPLVPRGFVGGLFDLQAKQRRDLAALRSSGLDLERGENLVGKTLTDSQQSLISAVNKRQPLIDELKRQANEITEALLHPEAGPTGFGGQLPAVKITATADSAKESLEVVRRLIAAEKDLADRRQLGSELGIRLVDRIKTAYQNLTTQLHTVALTDPFGEMAENLRDVVGQLDDAIDSIERFKRGQDAIAAAQARGIPGISVTPTGFSRPTIAPIVEPLKTISGGGPDVGGAVANGLAGALGAAARSIAGQLNPLSQIISAISAAAKPLIPVMTKLANIIATTLGPVFEAFAPVLEALLPVFDALLRVLSPVLRALAPLFQAFVPLLNALFPIFKQGAIIATYLFQAFAIGAAIFIRAIGNIVIGFGTIIKALAQAIDKLPFVSAKGAINSAQGIIDFGRALLGSADEFSKTAEEMAKARDEIRGINIDPTKTAIDALGNAAATATAALLNVPVGYKVALSRFRAQDYAPGFGPISTGGGPLGSGGGGRQSAGYPSVGGSGSNAVFQFAPGSIVIPGTDMTARELFDEFLEEAQRRARSQLGDPKRWSEVQV